MEDNRDNAHYQARQVARFGCEPGHLLIPFLRAAAYYGPMYMYLCLFRLPLLFFLPLRIQF